MTSKNSTWNNIPGFDRIKEEYVQLDLKQWLKDHRIKEEGERRGKQNQPAAEDVTLDEFESQIVDWVNRRGLVCRGNVNGYLADLERELADMESDATLSVLEDEVDELREKAEIAIERGVDDGRNQLTEDENAVRDGSAEFERFRRRAGLTRLADYSHRRTAHRYIFGCGLVEVVLNASLLMDVNPFGLLGSTIQMALISLVNVVFAGLVMGVLLRQSNHMVAWRKGIAWLGIILLLLAVAGFNLAVGHYRNSMQAVLNNPSVDYLNIGNDALQRLLDGPFELASFPTALLVLLGIVCFGIGAWKWYQRDDAYPGFGKLDRQLKNLKDVYAKAYRREQDKLASTHENYHSKLDDIRHKLVVTRSKWGEICKRGTKLVDGFPINLGQYQRDLDYLLAAYRTANKGARSTPPPPHFNDQVRVDEDISKPPLFNPPNETSLSGVASKVNGAIRTLQDKYRVARREFPTLEAVTNVGVQKARESAA